MFGRRRFTAGFISTLLVETALLIFPIVRVDLFEFQFFAVMSISSELIPEGDTIVINCTLTEKCNDTRYCHANNIYFKHAGKSYVPPENVQILNNNTSQFVFPNASADMFGAYNCYVTDFNAAQFKLIAKSVHLNVARSPRQPVISWCKVMNWEKLVCEWTPTIKEQHDHTHVPGSFVQKLWVRRGTLENAESDWKYWCSPMPDPGAYHPETEEWNKLPSRCNATLNRGNQTKMGDKLCVMVEADNALNMSKTSNPYCFDTIRHVEPNPPSVLPPDLQSARAIRLLWKKPSSSYSLSMTSLLTYKSEWDKTEVNVTVDDAEEYLLVSKPYTEYQWSVRVIPTVRGYLSDPCTIQTVRALATVPCAAPLLMSSSFTLKQSGEVSGNMRKVSIFWKSLNPADFCGPKFEYSIAYKSLDDKYESDWEETKTTDLADDIEITDAAYEFRIGARNDVGLSEEKHVIVVPSSQQLSEDADDYQVVAEGEADQAYVHWHGAELAADDITNITLYWCENVKNKKLCDNGIEWKELDPAARGYNFSMAKDFKQYVYGVSIMRRAASSHGIKWVDCLHAITELADAPKNLTALPSGTGEHDVLYINWKLFECLKAGKGYADSIAIYYCQATSIESCNDGALEMKVRAPSYILPYRLSDLEPGTSYRIRLRSVSMAGESIAFSNVVLATTSASWFTKTRVGLIAFGAVAFLGVAAVAVCTIYSYCRKLHQKFQDIRIALPEAVRPGGTTISSGTSAALNNGRYDKALYQNGDVSFTRPLLMQSISASTGSPQETSILGQEQQHNEITQHDDVFDCRTYIKSSGLHGGKSRSPGNGRVYINEPTGPFMYQNNGITSPPIREVTYDRPLDIRIPEECMKADLSPQWVDDVAYDADPSGDQGVTILNPKKVPVRSDGYIEASADTFLQPTLIQASIDRPAGPVAGGCNVQLQKIDPTNLVETSDNGQHLVYLDTGLRQNDHVGINNCTDDNDSGGDFVRGGPWVAQPIGQLDEEHSRSHLPNVGPHSISSKPIAVCFPMNGSNDQLPSDRRLVTGTKVANAPADLSGNESIAPISLSTTNRNGSAGSFNQAAPVAHPVSGSDYTNCLASGTVSKPPNGCVVHSPSMFHSNDTHSSGYVQHNELFGAAGLTAATN